MKKPRRCRFVLLFTLFACFSVSRSWSCGGGDDYLPPLKYLEGRCPGRSLGRLLREAGELQTLQGEDDCERRISKIVRDVGEQPAAEVLKEVDDCLVLARGHHSAKTVFALLHDLRDLLSAAAVSPEAMGSYAIWREARVEDKRPEYLWSTDPKVVAWKQGVETERGELEAFIKDCEEGRKPKGLLPHYYYAMGALWFRQIKDVQSEEWFMRVVKEFPDHPRAETALFMAGRSAVSQTRSGYSGAMGGGLPPADRVDHALKVLGDYHKRYPQGRFAGDVIGWEGAMWLQSGKVLEALRCYSQQLRFPGHPELAGPGAQMCETCLHRLAAEGAGGLKQAMAAVAHDPALTTALVYHLFTLPGPPMFQGDTREAGAEEQHKEMLQALAEALPSAEAGFQSKAWQPRFLAILAQTLSQCGRQKEALALLDRNAEEGAKVEEWLFARALVLERSDKLKEALATYQDFEKKFPGSPWLHDVVQRKAGVLKDMGEADKAVLMVNREVTALDASTPLDKRGPWYFRDEENGAGENITSEPILRETVQALLYGAPVDELTRLMAAEEPGLEDKDALKNYLARRLIALRRYKEAAALLPPGQVQEMGLDKLQGMPDAETLLDLARTWTAARGKWLCKVPLPISKDEVPEWKEPGLVPDKPGVRDPMADIFENVRTLYPAANDERQFYDELAHALDFCRRAAALAPADTRVGAEARLAGLDAMGVLVRGREDALEMARRNHWADESRKWWSELQPVKQGPVDVSRAVYWSFDGPRETVAPEPGSPKAWPPWMQWADDAELIFGGHPDFALANEGHGASDWRARQAIVHQLAELRTIARRADATELRNASNGLLATLERTMPGREASFMLNAVRDICLAGTQPGVPYQAWCRYADLRLGCLCNAAWGGWNLASQGLEVVKDSVLLDRVHKFRQDPGLASLADFLDALEISLEANSADRDWLRVENLCGMFLAGHASSAKREAVRLYLVRAAFRARRPSRSTLLRELAGLGFDTANEHVEAGKGQPGGWDSRPALDAIAAYRKEFPKGTFNPEVDDIAALVAWRCHDYPAALAMAAQYLADPDKNRQNDGRQYLANVVADLENPPLRVALLSALRKEPKVHEELKNYLAAIQTVDFHPPLAFMRDFVLEQVLAPAASQK